MQHMLLHLLLLSVACAHAGLLPLTSEFSAQPHLKVTSTVHNTPSAVSHQSFTRIHSQPSHIQAAAAVYDLDSQARILHGATASHSAPGLFIKSAAAQTAPVIIKSDTPIVETLTHTPAHLTYAASPVVFQMLPQFKPVRKISYDELLNRDSSYEYRV